MGIFRKIQEAKLRRKPIEYKLPVHGCCSEYEVKYMRDNLDCGNIYVVHGNSEGNKRVGRYVFKVESDMLNLVEKAIKYEKKGNDCGLERMSTQLIEYVERYDKFFPCL